MTEKNPSPVRVRFAPSPTGFLHIGGVRTALFNWLYARKSRGQFILRIEDTDLERSEEHFTQDILSSMKWLGLTWDEEPIYQSHHLGAYQEKVDELIRKGHAYRCYSTEEEIEKMREKAMAEGRKPMYDRTWRDRTDYPADGTPYVIRARLPLDGYVEFEDLIRGTIRIENQKLDDFVLIRSNGAPTYNLSVVVDDVGSRMTHIIRGEDHINNTPKQIHLYNFFGYPVPKFAHLPMILGSDKKKLSKRHGAVSTNLYRAEGYLPEALLNFLVRLGWSHGDQEVFSADEMIQFFDFDHVQKSGAVFNAEKLLWLNGKHLRKSTPERLAGIVVEDFAEHFKGKAELRRVNTAIGHQLVALIQPKVKLVAEIAEQLVPLCTPGAVEADTSDLKWNKNAELKTATKAAVAHALTELEARMAGVAVGAPREGADAAWGQGATLADAGFTHSEADSFLRGMGEQHGIKLGDFMQPLRLAITGRMNSVGIFDLLPILPWDVVAPRLKKIAEW